MPLTRAMRERISNGNDNGNNASVNLCQYLHARESCLRRQIKQKERGKSRERHKAMGKSKEQGAKKKSTQKRALRKDGAIAAWQSYLS